MDGLQVTATEVIVGGGVDCTVTEAVPDFVASSVLAAVTVTVPAAVGAVKSPLALIEPAAADHVTAELKLPVPRTVVVHCEVACIAIAEGEQVTETEEMEGDIGEEGFELAALPPPPQALIEKRTTHSIKASSSRVCAVFLLKWRREKLPIRAFFTKTPARNTITARGTTTEDKAQVVLCAGTKMSLHIDAIGGL